MGLRKMKVRFKVTLEVEREVQGDPEEYLENEIDDLIEEFKMILEEDITLMDIDIERVEEVEEK